MEILIYRSLLKLHFNLSRILFLAELGISAENGQVYLRLTGLLRGSPLILTESLRHSLPSNSENKQNPHTYTTQNDVEDAPGCYIHLPGWGDFQLASAFWSSLSSIENQQQSPEMPPFWRRPTEADKREAEEALAADY
ncbi:unnamed protein product, partial [Protopolystoma xenopodis]